MSGSKSILKSTVIVTIVTFGIKVLGLIKQAVLAAYCGATEETDAFFIASGVIFSLSTMLFSSISITLLTEHTNKLLKKGRTEANELINLSLRFFLPISLIVSFLFYVGAPFVAKFLAPSYQNEQLQMLSHYTQLMSGVFVLTCYYLIVNVVLETDKEFVPGRLYGFFLNAFMIVAAVFLFDSVGMEALIWAFIFSGIVECIVVTICAGKRFHIIFGQISMDKNEVVNLLKLSLPLIIGNALYEINDIVDKQISSGLGAGNASYLTYGATINEIVTGVIVGSVSVVLFSHFTTWVAEKEVNKVADGLNRSLEMLTIIILPILSMCIFAGGDIIRLFYGRGQFGENEIKATQMVVIGYALGFVFSSVRAIMVKVFYAFQDTKRPLINGLLSISINIVLSIILSRFCGIAGVAMATSIAMFVSSLLLFKQIKCYLPNFSVKESMPEYIKGVVACLLSSVAIFAVSFMDIENALCRLIIESVFCAFTYICALHIMQANSLELVSKLIRHNKE